MSRNRPSDQQYSRDQKDHVNRIEDERQQLMQLMHEVRGVL